MDAVQEVDIDSQRVSHSVSQFISQAQTDSQSVGQLVSRSVGQSVSQSDSSLARHRHTISRLVSWSLSQSLSQFVNKQRVSQSTTDAGRQTVVRCLLHCLAIADLTRVFGLVTKIGEELGRSFFCVIYCLKYFFCSFCIFFHKICIKGNFEVMSKFTIKWSCLGLESILPCLKHV